MKFHPPTMSVISQYGAPDEPCQLNCDCLVRVLNGAEGNVVNPVSHSVIYKAFAE